MRSATQRRGVLCAIVAISALVGVAHADTTLLSAVSRRQHGAAGDFDISVPLASAAREPRQNGVNPRLVLTFSAPPVATDGVINCGQEVIVSAGTCNSVSVSGNDLTVKMTFAKNTCVTVQVTGIVGLTGDSDVTIVTQEGDTNGNGAVNILDLNATKIQLNQPVAAGNFKNDVNVNGSINILDLNAIKNNLNQVPGGPPQPIAYGQTSQGGFTAECQVATYEFTGQTGDIITFYYLGGTGVNAQSVNLRKPDGSQVSPATGVGTFWQLADFNLSAGGTYRIVVQAAANVSGGFSLLLYKRTIETTALTLNAATNGEINPLGQWDEYTFSAVAGSTVIVDFSTPTVNGRPDLVVRLDLVRPSGTTAATDPSCGTTNRISNAAINETGAWRVRVRAYENWANCAADTAIITGAYTLSVCTSNTAPEAIAYGQVKSANFAADCQTINYDFSGQNGDHAFIYYLGPTQGSRMRLLKSDGSQVATVTLGVGGFIEQTLAANDTYRIAVEAQDGFSGPFSLSLSNQSAAVPIALNTPTNGTLDMTGEVDMYSFQGVTGSTVTVDLATPTVSNRPDVVTRLDLVRPSGTTAATNPTCNATNRISNATLNETGTWLVRVRAYENWPACGGVQLAEVLTGAYTLSVCTSNTAAEAIAYGQTKNGAFAADCQTVNYDFTGQTGDVVFISYIGPTQGGRMRLLRSDGTQVATVILGVGGAISDQALPANDTYRIAVEAQDGSTGPFSISLYNQSAAAATPIVLNTPTNGSLDVIAEVDLFSFQGVAGSTVTVDFVTPTVTGRPDVVSRLDLIRPSGTTAATNPTCNATNRINNAALNETGTWLVRVRAYENWTGCVNVQFTDVLTGSYTLSVCTSNTAPVAIAYGQTKNGTFAADCQTSNYDFTGQTGDVVFISYIGPTQGGRMRLLRSDGTQVATVILGVGGAISDQALPANDTYRIAVEAQDGSTGPFSISLYNQSAAAATPIVLNTPTNGSLDVIAEVDLFSFQGVAGSTATVDFVTPTVNTRPDIISRLDLIRPSGTTAATNPTCSATNRLSNVAINETGPWLVRVRTYENWTGCVGVQFTEVLTGAYTLSVCTSNTAPVAIAYGQTKNGTFAADCQTSNYDFTGQTGEVVFVTYIGPTQGGQMRLLRSDGTQLATVTLTTAGTISDATLPANETYRIAVEAQDGSLGPFSVGLNKLNPAGTVPLTSGVLKNGSLDALAEVDLYSFQATAGKTVTVNFTTPVVTGDPDVISRIDLIRPAGTTAVSNPTCSTTNNLNNAAINETGTWLVRVRAYENWPGCVGPAATGVLTGAYTITATVSP